MPISTAHKLKAKGYRTELCVMAVKPEISYESTILRYENAIAFGEIPRATSKAHHDMVVDRIADNLDVIYKTGVLIVFAFTQETKDVFILPIHQIKSRQK